MRLCGLGVEMPGRWPDGKCQRHQRQKSAEISRCLRPETLPFVCQMLETDGARWDFARASPAREIYISAGRKFITRTRPKVRRDPQVIFAAGKDASQSPRLPRARGFCAFYCIKEKRKEEKNTRRDAAIITFLNAKCGKRRPSGANIHRARRRVRSGRIPPEISFR